MDVFTQAKISPELGSQIFEALGVSPVEFEIPRRFKQLQDIGAYLMRYENPRYKLLQVVSEKSGDKIDIAWTWVQLQKEKEAKVRSLDPKDFEPDVAAELSQGFLSLQKRRQVEADIARRRQEVERKRQREQEAHLQAQKEKAISQVDKLTKVEETMKEIDNLDRELSYYGA